MKIKGFDEFQKKLNQLAKNAKQLDGQHEVLVTELLGSRFLSRHTNISSAGELFEKSGFKIESPEGFTAIPDEEWDEYIRLISSFSNWEEMLSKATEQWTANKLGF